MTKKRLISGAVLLACIAICWIRLSGPTGGPIAFGLQSYTNACAVVGITNRSAYQFHYVVMTERKIGGEWPQGLQKGARIPEGQFGSLRPGQLTNLTIPVMVYVPPYPWRVSIFYSKQASIPNSLRFKASFLALKLGMRKLSHKLLGGGDFEQIQASTPETEQWEK
jgi:hypothetical protein